MKLFIVAIFLIVALSFGEAISVHSRKARAIVDSFLPEMGRFVRDLATVHNKRDAEDTVEEAVADLADLADEVGEGDLKKRDESDESSEEEFGIDDLLGIDLKRAAQKRKIAVPKRKTEIRAVKPKRRIDFFQKFLPNFDYKRSIGENAHEVVKRSVESLLERFKL